MECFCDPSVPRLPFFRPKLVVSAFSEVCDWGQQALKVHKFRELTGCSGEYIKVAILDSGIDTQHRDLKDNIKEAIDFTGCGAHDTVVGHGTHVAGIIGAKANGVGVIGVAPDCQLYSLRVLDNEGTARSDYSTIKEAIYWCIDNDIDIINMSFGAAFEPPASLHAAIQSAALKGIIIVAASGNESSRSICWPARYEEVIAVAAIDRNNCLADFSNYNGNLDAVAPGVDIFSTWINNQYAKMSGTSMATPYIAGILALMLSYHRNGALHYTALSNYKEAIEHLRRFERGSCVTKLGENLGIGIIDLSSTEVIESCEAEYPVIISHWSILDDIIYRIKRFIRGIQNIWQKRNI